MSVELLDGPCKGAYLVKRCPMFLRAVQNRTGETDILDQIKDSPKKNETIFIYMMEGNPGWIHLYMSPRSKSGFYATGKYRYLPDIPGEQFRDNAVWQSWATEQMNIILPECPQDESS
ncbi:MAG: hypothetical protein PHU23_08710 [Dehalococcoidales bacterium]|nr:hypothetical protein [Dehalococcoidales bacterium]